MMKILSTSVFNDYEAFKENALFGRRITLEDIEPLIKNLDGHFKYSQIGSSELKKPIYKISFGIGSKRILIWSQMHGNESTGTKAIFDLIRFLSANTEIAKILYKNCTLVIIPMLNPDGAEAYTRVNANNVDLNRDAVNREAKESKILRAVLEDVNPRFCFNLHDQRTIFGVEETKLPATLSFLAPSEEVSRKVTKGRIETMNVIVAMNSFMKQIIPGQIGRYTDEFYPNATGDNFQKLGYNTILIESGHYQNDYEREEVRKFTFQSLLQGIYYVSISDTFSIYQDYFTIPNNVKIFYDIVHRYRSKEDEVFQYEEIFMYNALQFIPKKIEDIDVKDFCYHKEIVFEE